MTPKRLFSSHYFPMLALCLFAISVLPGSRAAEPFWPGVEYDPGFPTMEQVLGFGPAERIASHAEIVKYMEALAAAAPDRMRLTTYAESWEGRSLIYAAIGSKENVARLDELRSGMHALSDPRVTNERTARDLADSLPVPVWLGYGVHGDEISSPDAAMLTAYHLLAAKDHDVAKEILAGAVVFIDPLQNPDGRDRFVHHYDQNEGLLPDESPLAAEHHQPWPGGRFNHYLFDMNRDWLAMTQPESRGRIKAFLEWYPLVVADLHEMGANSTYYFAPAADPFNPHLTEGQLANNELIGRGNAKWFDEFGFDYFTREVFDSFYPGYGDSWPAFYGAASMTYEMASSSGLEIRRNDGIILTFRDGVRRHFVASLATAQTAANNRAKLLADFYEYRATAIDEGKRESTNEYVLPATGDVSAAAKLAALLAAHGIEVKRATEAFGSGGEKYPAGSYVISLAQPAKRLIRTLLDARVPLDAEFMKEQERRRAKKLGDQIYDVTAWSLPIMFGVPCIASGGNAKGVFEPVASGETIPATLSGASGKVAYLVPWGSAAAARLLTAALRDGLVILTADKAFTQAEFEYPAGTLIFKTSDNPVDLAGRLRTISAETGASVCAVDTSWVDNGINFGSDNVFRMRRPRIALAWDEPTQATSAGACRFVLERQFGYPVTAVKTRMMGSVDLAEFHVVILPDVAGDYAEAFGEDGAAALGRWVESGGVLIGLGGAVSYLADAGVGLLDVKTEYLAKEGEEKKESPEPSITDEDKNHVPGKLLASEEDYRKAIQAEKEAPDSVPGVLVRAKVDSDHWIAAGLPETLNVLYTGNRKYTPITLDKGVNAAFYEGPADLLLSGYMWEENRKQLAYKPFLIVQPKGRGVVVGFTSDPNTRAYMDGLNVAFLNAIFRGAAHTMPVTDY